MFKTTILLLIFAATVYSENDFVCGKTKIDSRIVGGKVAKKGAHPWQAAIVSSYVFYSFCGGALINKRWVLTAAHCTVNKAPEDMRVAFGSVQLDEDGETIQVIDVEKIVNHPEYTTKRYVNDIALLKLKQEVNITQTVIPICLPQKEWTTFSNLMATGYGLTHRYGFQSSELMEVSLEQRDQEKCTRMYKKEEFGESHICANDKGKDVCRGDSGGPLVTKKRGVNYIVGVVSYGFVCGYYAKPSVFTRVTSFLDWIDENIKS